MKGGGLKLAIALLHHPVMNKSGETIGSAVTNLDLHDISRAARTYGVSDYYVATPFEDQRQLIDEITDHWRNGHGATANPSRREALSIVRPTHGLEDIVAELSSRYGRRPFVVATSARQQPQEVGYDTLSSLIQEGRAPVLLLFGTAHGLAPEIMETVDAVLPPIGRNYDYNHLSVRSAVSIILDRLIGDRCGEPLAGDT